MKSPTSKHPSLTLLYAINLISIGPTVIAFAILLQGILSTFDKNDLWTAIFHYSAALGSAVVFIFIIAVIGWATVLSCHVMLVVDGIGKTLPKASPYYVSASAAITLTIIATASLIPQIALAIIIIFSVLRLLTTIPLLLIVTISFSTTPEEKQKSLQRKLSFLTKF